MLKFFEKLDKFHTHTCMPEKLMMFLDGKEARYLPNSCATWFRSEFAVATGVVQSGVSTFISITASLGGCKSSDSGSGVTTTFSIFTGWGNLCQMRHALKLINLIYRMDDL